MKVNDSILQMAGTFFIGKKEVYFNKNDTYSKGLFYINTLDENLTVTIGDIEDAENGTKLVVDEANSQILITAADGFGHKNTGGDFQWSISDEGAAYFGTSISTSAFPWFLGQASLEAATQTHIVYVTISGVSYNLLAALAV